MRHPEAEAEPSAETSCRCPAVAPVSPGWPGRWAGSTSSTGSRASRGPGDAQAHGAPEAGAGDPGEPLSVGLGRELQDRGPLAGGRNEGQSRTMASKACAWTAATGTTVQTRCLGADGERRDLVARVRIGLVCPYSLTVPGGVQGQVLGLARSLRAMGHEARVLAPCDGHRPSCSSSLSATRSRPPPTAPSPRWRRTPPASCASSGPRRRGLRRPPPPRAAGPGADDDGADHAPGADRGDVPRRRGQHLLPTRQPQPQLAGRAAGPALSPSPTTPANWRSATSAAPTTCSSTAWRSSATGWTHRSSRRVRRSSSAVATSPARGSTCC